MKDINNILEFNKILEMLSQCALAEESKAKLLKLEIELNESRANMKMKETTEARKLIDSIGMPPLSSMKDMEEILTRVEIGTMLEPKSLENVASFIKGCRQMQRYLARAEYLGCDLAFSGRSFCECEDLKELIELSIRNNTVDSNASTELKGVRRQIENTKTTIKARLEKILQSKREYLADFYIMNRGDHYVLAVKKEYKAQVEGRVFDTSRTGSTVFVEPAGVGRLQEELSRLQIDEENEVRKILYALTNEVEAYLPQLKANMEMMMSLDITFAKGKLSLQMKASPATLSTERVIVINQGRHPLLPANQCVPLNFKLGGETRGVIITGPNTGGKTVTLKTIGLLSMMAQAGLHVPAEEGSRFTLNNQILCDIGDGQSIEESLSTFSSHIVNIIDILNRVTPESLILLDELGSGTDPKEGMGIAIAILEVLRQSNCLMVATTHYPEVKGYAAQKVGLINARMQFDKESLRPLYTLQIGEAGESCALYIAEKLGLSQKIVALARGYSESRDLESSYIQDLEGKVKEKKQNKAAVIVKENKTKLQEVRKFKVGDCVLIYPEKKKGIVFNIHGDRGKIGVQLQKSKLWINHKRLKLLVEAGELYPEDYDFSIIFDSVANRKARHKMGKGYQGNFSANYEEGQEWKS